MKNSVKEVGSICVLLIRAKKRAKENQPKLFGSSINYAGL
ncbi:hypothetical protein N473_13420 [Pseudoalteromonas luteoviolacea CPMOR-1]|uniref:Uncharacterized protein n=1 Tax=Pseudoalteromonas luteoviolacea CPMOR-1 TaxID=1365248 RepID=A0A167LLG8_9GAMM|nr:hypothetical protein N473_13420 [Pseudoalteromonas luteoviolacea CPMOR-1]